MKKIIAINSPLFENQDVKNNEDYLPPLGLGIIITSLNNYDVKFIDSIGDNLGLQEIIVAINKLAPNYVLINIFTTNFQLVKNIVEAININTHWIIGGLSTKSLYKEIFKWKTKNTIDIIYGDGEIIVRDIVKLSVKETPFDIYDKNKRFYLITPSSNYYVRNILNEKLNRNIFKNEPQKNIYGESEVCIYTSRGCPFNCAYCVAANSRNRELGKIRRKTKDSIISELNIIESMYNNVKAIRILDDLFLSNKKSFNDAILVFNEFNYNWRAMCHIKSIDNVEDSILSKIKRCGCKELSIGIELGSSKILKKIHKTYNLKVIKKSIKRVLKNGINVKGYFICGFPSETKEELKKTFELCKELTDFANKNDAIFRNSTFQFRPYYGTELYEEIIAKNDFHRESILYKIKISKDLNENVRNKSFNFDSGNYSNTTDEELKYYIKLINDLNNEYF